MPDEPTAPVVASSADAMAMLLGTTANADGTIPMPGTVVSPAAPAADPAASATPAAPVATTTAEILQLTGPEAVAKVNELLAERIAKDAEIADWKSKSRTNERLKKEARAALKALGSSAVDANGQPVVHTGGEDDDDDRQDAAASTLRQENMRLRAALAAGLSDADAGRLVGDTQEALNADALAFKARLAPSARPQGRGDGGTGAVLKTLSPHEEFGQLVSGALRRQ